MLQSWAGLKDPYFGPGITKYSLIQSKRVDGLWIAHLGSASAHYKVDHGDEFQIYAESEKGGSGLLQTGKVVTRIHLTIIINLSWFIAIVTMWHSNNGPS
jgi:hypothetical protein